MAFEWLILSVFFSRSNAAGIELLQCEPPDLPVRGSYGPKLTYYIPGDVINYYCDVDTYIGGNFYRKCLDTGDWTGDAPVCGRANLEILIVKENGVEVACARHTRNIDRYDWTVLTCPGPDNRGATGLKIRSLTNDPLKICEIQAYVLASPKCVDPHYRIENGRLRLTRKTATLVCDGGYTRSPDSKLECVREGEWNRKTLYCTERQWDVDDREPLDNDDEIRPTDAEPTISSKRERLRSRSRS